MPRLRPLSRRARALLVVWSLLWAGGLAAQITRSYFSHTVLTDVSGQALPLPSKPLAHRLVIVLYDALRYDTANDPQIMPAWNRLAAQGASGLALTTLVPMTGIGVRTIGTGVTADLLDIVRNWDMRPVEFDNLFKSAHAAGKRIAFVGDEPWIQLFGQWADFEYTVPDLGIADIDQSDPKVWQAGLYAIASGRYDVVVVHFVGTDHAGHKYRSDSPEYAAKAHQLDGFLDAAWALLRDDPGAVLCGLADHGSAPNGNHGSDEPDARRTAFFLVGAGVAPVHGLTLSQLDYAATFSALLGLPYPGPSEGRIAVEALALEPADRAAVLVDNLRQRLRYLHAYAARTSSMADPSDAPLVQAQSDLARGDTDATVADATTGLASLEDQYSESLSSSPVYPLTWAAIVALAVAVLILCARTEELPGMALMAVAGAVPLLIWHAATPAGRESVSLGIVLLHGAAFVVALRSAWTGKGLARVLLPWIIGAGAFEACEIYLFVDAGALSTQVPRVGLYLVLAAVGVGLAAAVFIGRRAVGRWAENHPTLAMSSLLLALSAVPSRAEIPTALGMLVIGLAISARRARAEGVSAPRAMAPTFLVVALGVPFAIGWMRLGWQLSELQLPGPAVLSSPTFLSLAGGGLSAAYFIRLGRNMVGLRFRILVCVSGASAAAALVALLLPDNGPSASILAFLVNAVLMAAAATALLAIVTPGLPNDRAAALAAAGFAALLILSRGAQVLLLPAALLLAEHVFSRLGRSRPPSPDAASPQPTPSSDALRTAALGAAALVLLRLLVFGFTEGRFYFSAIDVRVAFAGDAGEQHLLRPILILSVRFALPFVILGAQGLRHLDSSVRRRTAILTLAFLGWHLVHLALVCRVALRHFWVIYDLVGEITFFLFFVGSLVIADGLVALARRDRSGDTYPIGNEADGVQPRAKVA
jgi:hypothetical protein